MKASTKKRVQLLVLFVALALNTSWVQNINRSYEASIASVSLITRSAITTKSCDEVKNKSRNKAVEKALKFDRKNTDLVSIDWDLRVFSYTCVKDDKEKVMTSFNITNEVSENSATDWAADEESEFCLGCLEKAVNTDASFKGSMAGQVTEANLQDLADIINKDLDQKENDLVNYIKKYQKNRKSVELDCTKSWTGDGKGTAISSKKVKSNEEIKECRMDVLASHEFGSESKRYAYFKKHFYKRLREDILNGNQETLEEVREELENFMDHDSGAIRKAAQQLALLDRYTTNAFRLDRRHAAILARCNREAQYANSHSDSFHSDTLLHNAKECQKRVLYTHRVQLDALSRNAHWKINRLISPRSSDSLNIREQGLDLLANFQDRIDTLSEHPGSLARNDKASTILPDNFSRRSADLALAASALLPKFTDPNPNFYPTFSLDRTVDITGYDFRH